MALRKITNIYTKIQKHKFKTTKILNSDKKYKKQSHRSLDGL